MGSKPSNNFQSDRPESGGADHDEQMEKSGLLEREKQEFAAQHRQGAKGKTRRAGVERPAEPGVDTPDGTPSRH